MTQLVDVTKPGLMISQTWPTTRERHGDTLAAIETALDAGFFRALQTVEIPCADERTQIAALLKGAGIPLTCTLARVINDNRLNLADLVEHNRRKSCRHIIHSLDDAREAGATTVGLISGPAPANPGQRAESLLRLANSLTEICRAAQATPALTVIIEPLDVAAHKKGALGTTAEAIDLCRRVQANGFGLRLCLDTAHILLNGENLLEMLLAALPFIGEYHYCNCVTDISHPLFGDHHLPFGPPGVVNVTTVAQLMGKSVELGFFNADSKPAIFCEVFKREQDDSLAVMDHCRQIMQQAWNIHQNYELRS